MKYSYDLHIHSVLSPCSDSLMTPNNILNMALITELDFIAVTDHNSLKQYIALEEISTSYDFCLIYGVEVSVSEGFHVLVFIENYRDAFLFDAFLEDHIIKNPYDIEYYGYQIITDVYDEEESQYPYLLTNNLDLCFDDLFKEIRRIDGLIIPAHLDKKTTSGLEFLLEHDYDIDGYELSCRANPEQFVSDYPMFKDKKLILDSDAHIITDINLEPHYLDLESKTVSAFFNYFRSRNNE